jgi:hypothetical protein
MALVPAENVYRFLSDNGTANGNKLMVGNYSGGTTEFWIENTERAIQIRRMVIEIRDSGPFTSDKYGAISGGLSNGIEVKVKDPSDVVQLDLTDGLPIKVNAHWGRFCYDVSDRPSGAGDGFLNIRWTFNKGGSDLLLEPEWRLVVELSDDLRALADHTMFVHGTFAEGG